MAGSWLVAGACVLAALVAATVLPCVLAAICVWLAASDIERCRDEINDAKDNLTKW